MRFSRLAARASSLWVRGERGRDRCWLSRDIDSMVQWSAYTAALTTIHTYGTDE